MPDTGAHMTHDGSSMPSLWDATAGVSTAAVETPMPAREDRVRVRDESMRARFAIAKGLTAMAAEEREMERAMKAFEEDADQAKRYIEGEWRREHWGLEPERPPAWEAR